MNWLILTRQEQVALLFLTGSLLLGCLVLVADAWRQEGLPDFHVIPGAVEPPAVVSQGHPEAADAAVAMPEMSSGAADPPLVVPQGSPASVAVAAETSADSTIAINSADLAAWDSLPGIGPRTATAIIEFRRQHGRFSSIDELTQVRGIGVGTVTRLRSRLRLD
ncbi:MAG: ComEA family DNA-binding protein [Gemmatimonadetes bacterium]|jgi:comEA protein|nr:ComEA family DNA-binding protein [Gemmatimonadota bacterium]